MLLHNIFADLNFDAANQARYTEPYKPSPSSHAEPSNALRHGDSSTPKNDRLRVTAAGLLGLSKHLYTSALVGARAALAQAVGAAKFPADLPYISPRILQTFEAKPSH